MFCRKCGYQFEGNVRFCPRCGEILDFQGNAGGNNYNNGSWQYQNGNAGGNNYNNGSWQYQNGNAGGNNYNNGSWQYQNGNAGGNNYNNGSWQYQNAGQNYVDNGSLVVRNKQKTNWRDFFQMDNIERYAPIATLIPLPMAVICGIIGSIGRYAIIFNVLSVLLKIIFLMGTVGATAGLIYVIVKKKNLSLLNVWIAPLGTLLATISCLGIAFGWTVVAWIFGIFAVVLGIEFVARIVINGMPIESPINYGLAFNTYKRYFETYKAKYPSTKDLERAGFVAPENSKFDGSGIELLGYSVLTGIVCMITCGIAAPWMICKINKWRTSHTVINGKRLVFTGNGASLLGHWILWEILCIVTCGIYGLFMYVALRKWTMSHTYIEGEPISPNGNDSYFDGDVFSYVGYSIVSALILMVTCGLAYPWVMAMIQKWDTGHQVINGRRLAFSGSGAGFLGEYLIIFILSIITCGIYAPWGTVRMNKYIIRHTDFVA